MATPLDFQQSLPQSAMSKLVLPQSAIFKLVAGLTISTTLCQPQWFWGVELGIGRREQTPVGSTCANTQHYLLIRLRTDPLWG